MWVARDKDGKLAIFNKKQFKDREQWIVKGMFAWIPSKLFPEVQWSDEEPAMIKLVIEDKK